MIDRHADEIIFTEADSRQHPKLCYKAQMTKYALNKQKRNRRLRQSFCTDVPLSEAEQDLQFFNAELKKSITK